MRRKIILESGESYAVNVSSLIKYLIIREATGNVLFGNENNQFIELSRSDKAVIDIYQGQRVEFINNNETQIAVDFQFSHIPLSIEEQTTSVNGAITVSEITKPVTVGEIIKPVVVDEIRKAVDINTVYDELKFIKDVTWQNTPIDRGEWWKYKYVMVQANANNNKNIVVFGVAVPPGGYYEITTPFTVFELHIEFLDVKDLYSVVYIKEDLI